MTRYVVFLRAINVGGRSVIKMGELIRRLEKAGLKGVSSYRQSGNVILSSTVTDAEQIVQMVSDQLEQTTGFRVEIFILTIDRIKIMVDEDPFDGQLSKDDRGFATIISQKPSDSPMIPLSLKPGIVMIGLTDNVVFSLVKKDVGSGPLNNLVERRFGVKGTTRNWTTMKALADKASCKTNGLDIL